MKIISRFYQTEEELKKAKYVSDILWAEEFFLSDQNEEPDIIIFIKKEHFRQDENYNYHIEFMPNKLEQLSKEIFDEHYKWGGELRYETVGSFSARKLETALEFVEEVKERYLYQY